MGPVGIATAEALRAAHAARPGSLKPSSAILCQNRYEALAYADQYLRSPIAQVANVGSWPSYFPAQNS